ncbi:HesA/MoeB/ThiF family protein [Aquimarina agarilytica]|uniref:HesA/MoeB/ThiF family protein n=1 Tax=Aquimarina agarilytica TaxID=1087449 RepID=UPI000288A2E1|nr:HesA/MoeB/ThiF family protein [Aquimarina agarilytica]
MKNTNDTIKNKALKTSIFNLQPLTSEEKNQYHRHLILDQIGMEGQLKLKQTKVLVIGAGGLGCPVLQYLTAAGVGTIGIIDGDKVDQSNLQRQILYTTDDVGHFKAASAASRLSKLNPFVKFEVFNIFLSTENAIDLFNQFDIIVDGTDNFPTRYLVNDACVLANKPLVFGSIFKFQGQVSVFNYKGSGTYRCLFPTPPAPNSVPNCSDVGVLGVLPGIIGSLQANETIKLIVGIGTPLVDKLLYFDALSLQQQVLQFQKNNDIKVTTLESNYEFFCGVSNTNDMNTISAEAYLKNKENYHLLDVRTYHEYEDENIGGQHIPLDELDDRMGEIPNSKILVVMCLSGKRSAAAIELLLENNYPKTLLNLDGGITAVLKN